jgi:hypothetical protein
MGYAFRFPNITQPLYLTFWMKTMHNRGCLFSLDIKAGKERIYIYLENGAFVYSRNEWTENFSETNVVYFQSDEVIQLNRWRFFSLMIPIDLGTPLISFDGNEPYSMKPRSQTDMDLDLLTPLKVTAAPPSVLPCDQDTLFVGRSMCNHILSDALFLDESTIEDITIHNTLLNPSEISKIWNEGRKYANQSQLLFECVELLRTVTKFYLDPLLDSHDFTLQFDVFVEVRNLESNLMSFYFFFSLFLFPFLSFSLPSFLSFHIFFKKIFLFILNLIIFSPTMASPFLGPYHKF